MLNRIKTLKGPTGLALMVTAFLSYESYAQEMRFQPSAAQKHSMSDRHKKLAQMHVKMAECLESDRPATQCRDEMMESCSNNFAGYCPMMDMGRMGGPGHGRMYGSYMDWMMSPDSDSNPTAPKTPSAKDAP